jgi:hypothetical protein
MPMQTIKHNQRRRSLALVTLAILFAPLFAMTALAEARSAQAQQQRPNIVVIMTDDQETSSLLHMPKLHRLIAEQGILERLLASCSGQSCWNLH